MIIIEGNLLIYLTIRNNKLEFKFYYSKLNKSIPAFIRE